VVLMVDPGDYGFVVFLELDLVVGSELGPWPANGGQVFMPHDFPDMFGPRRGRAED
jgi:hypothetical protein